MVLQLLFLLLYARYYGHFKNGRRHGYGVLYYATGARYEGFWHGDQKHGIGCYCFENGEVGLCGRFTRWWKYLLYRRRVAHNATPCAS